MDVIDLKTMTLARKVEVGKESAGGAGAARWEGGVCFLHGGNQVAEIDLATWKVSRMIATGNGTDGLGWAK